jgi:hypothetical protein
MEHLHSQGHLMLLECTVLVVYVYLRKNHKWLSFVELFESNEFRVSLHVSLHKNSIGWTLAGGPCVVHGMGA